MNDATINSIKQVINLIDERAKEPIDLDQLAKEVGISKYYLHRLFKSITNRSLMTYVGDRRLSLSASMLLNSDKNIIDVATEYKFGCEQSYIRAFKKKYNITPAQYRKTHMNLPIEQKFDVNKLYDIGLEDGLVMEPRLCVKQKFCVQGLESLIIHTDNLGNETTNQQAEKMMADYIPYLKNVIDPDVYIGLVRYTDCPDYSGNYLSGTEVEIGSPYEEPIVSYDIDTHEYLVYRYVGFHSPHQINYRRLINIYHCIDELKIIFTFHQAAPFHFERLNQKKCSDD